MKGKKKVIIGIIAAVVVVGIVVAVVLGMRRGKSDKTINVGNATESDEMSSWRTDGHPYLDPKCTWAVRHPEFFPVEINTAPKAALLRIPGIGPKSALRILSARRQQHLGMAELKRMGVVLKRAQYFITCNGRAAAHGTRQEIAAALLDPKAFAVGTQQLSLDDFTPKVLPDTAPAVQKLAAAGMPARQAAYEVKQEALQCLTRRM